MIAFIGLMMSGGATAQPTRSPVDANAFEIASTSTTYGAIAGRNEIGSTCFAPPIVSIQYT